MSESDVRVEDYSDAAAQEWDELVASSTAGTFLHTRRFLSYHGARFADASALLREARSGRLVAVFPAARGRTPGYVDSHPGSTFGGVVHDGSLSGWTVIAALEALRTHYAALGFERLRYKAVPWIYHRRPSADDVYGLVACGAALTHCDLSCAIDLEDRGPASARRRRGRRKAQAAGVELVGGTHLIAPLWRVIEENLRCRHNAQPTHTADELALLAERFPAEISVVAARLGGELVAGLVLFRSGRVVHAQYIAASERGREVAALDALFEHAIVEARVGGARYFDFGISTEHEGTVLNAGLHRFKAEFGGGGCVHEFFELALD